MKISRDWLSDFVLWNEADPAAIADLFTRSVGEVDDVVEQGSLLNGCVVGRIQTVGKHPNADKLSICTVQTDQGEKRVVCGGSNLKVDMLVAFAHVGATVKAGGKELVTLQKVKIRGEESEGMLCASEELDLQSLFPSSPEQGARPIADLTAGKYKVGTPLKKALGMNDVVFHVDNHAITNRPDLFSHVGTARELVAMGLASWKKKSAAKKPAFPKNAPAFRCINDIPTLVPRYCACTISIESAGVTPDWMKKRLEATGWRSINLPVDITNYVSMELGMPLHSFDTDDLSGDVHIRTAKKGEKIKTLDDVERVLPEGAIVLSDSKGVFDLLGIMGGLRSSTKTTTKNLYLHAAIVDPVSIRKAIIATGHRTEASTVYEKGIPRASAELGFFRALELILEHVPGARITSTMESAGKDDVRKAVTMPVDMVQKVTGANITAAQTKKILSDLGCTVTATKKDMKVMPPAWRNDLLLPQDIVEEVARIYGYAKIPAVMPEASTALPPRSFALHQIRDALKSQKFTELIHLAFTSPQIIRASGSDPAKAVSIENPIGEELSLMRMNLLPAMLETVSRQLTQTDLPHIAVYEHGHVFAEKKESHEMTLLIAARSDTGITNDPFLMAKRALVDAAAIAGYALTFTSAKSIASVAHAGRTANIIASSAVIGQIFEVHPAIRQSFGLPARAAAAVINLDQLFKVSPSVTLAKAIPLFPAIIFDETVPLGSGQSQQSLVTRLQKVDPLLESITVRDYYAQGTNRNVTFRFTYRSADRTLTQQEVDAVHKKVLAELAASGR